MRTTPAVSDNMESTGDEIRWRPPAAVARSEFGRELRALVPHDAVLASGVGYLFCPFVAFVHHAVSRHLAPGSESPLAVSLAISFLSPFAVALYAVITAALTQPILITKTRIWIPSAKLHIHLKRLVGWRIRPDGPFNVLLLKTPAGQVVKVSLPTPQIEDLVAQRLRGAAPEDAALCMEVDKPVVELLRLPPSVAVYGVTLLYGMGAAFLDARILTAVRMQVHFPMQLVAAVLVATNLVIGPGIILGWRLRRLGYNARVVRGYALGLNFLSASLAMLFTLAFFLAGLQEG